MSRDIRFRAWDTEDKKMWTADSLEYGILTDGTLLACHNISGDFNSCEEPIVLMQYTGLNDKNGKEIYQGDILKIARDKANYGATSYGGFAEVTAKTCGFALRCFNPSFDEIDEHTLFDEDNDMIVWDSSSLWHIDDDNGKNVEVIGNIYENPELLPNGKDE